MDNPYEDDIPCLSKEFPLIFLDDSFAINNNKDLKSFNENYLRITFKRRLLISQKTQGLSLFYISSNNKDIGYIDIKYTQTVKDFLWDLGGEPSVTLHQKLICNVAYYYIVLSLPNKTGLEYEKQKAYFEVIENVENKLINKNRVGRRYADKIKAQKALIAIDKYFNVTPEIFNDTGFLCPPLNNHDIEFIKLKSVKSKKNSKFYVAKEDIYEYHENYEDIPGDLDLDSFM